MTLDDFVHECKECGEVSSSWEMGFVCNDGVIRWFCPQCGAERVKDETVKVNQH